MKKSFLSKLALLFLFGLTIINAQDSTSPDAENSSSHSQIRDQVVRVGDVLEISLKEDAAFLFKGAVTQSGTIKLRYVGEQKVTGYSLSEIKENLTEKLINGFYYKVTLSVSLVDRGPGQIYVYGAVKEPGTVALEPGTNLSIPQAISLTKGLTSWADPSKGYILRKQDQGNQIRIDVDIRDTVKRGSEDNQTIILHDGDELYIPGFNDNQSLLLSNDDREIIVVGQVTAPGIVLFSPGEECTLMRCIFKAGGFTKFAKGNAVKLIRYQGGERTVTEVDADSVIEKGFLENDIELFPGDMLIVPQKLVNF